MERVVLVVGQVAFIAYNIIMTKNPLFNGLAVSAYIFLIALFFRFATKLASQPDTILAPMAAISLFTLSAAVMGYFFGYTPFVLYFDGKKKEAAKLFLQTTAVFGCITLLVLILLFSGR